ncbi:beta-galactosidase-like [Dermacentor andersoni]|uniref:beta-galactosidase-like n=1 Tax=Dermacentor andersoni TaxID=34620 RepID=UPI0024180D07|nr:beta-galactosidase-like [Dermacentor andersoni]
MIGDAPAAVFKVLAVVFWAQATLLEGPAGAPQKGQRSFVIDYENNRYLKDGVPIQIVSGSIHSFRSLPQQWDDRLATMRAAGLNAIQTYVEWSSHEPEEGQFNFEGQQDIVRFLRLAQKHDLLVLLRPGPYIDSERDMGGLPYWLLSTNRSIGLRTSDPHYIAYVHRYISQLLPLIQPLLYVNGGPVIAIQVENEYGSYAACDYVYTAYLRGMIRLYLGNDVVLYTTDGDADGYLKCGKLDGAYTTVDFGTGSDIGKAFAVQRRHQERGPLVNSEYYTGWMDHWAEPHSVVSTSAFVSQLDKMLSMNASVNMYVFHGGTSFGYKSGANVDDHFHPIPTSYDFDAPITEAGDTTDKYHAIRKTIAKYLPLPPGPVPKPKPKMALGPFKLRRLFGLSELREMLSRATITSERPLTFEEIRQSQALVLYDTFVSFLPRNPGALRVPGLRDRGYIYVDDLYQGVISRMDNVFDIMVSVTKGQRLSLLVESQGRNAYGDLNDAKGIISDVTLSGIVLTHWNITPIDERKSLSGNLAVISQRNRHICGTGGFGAYEARFPLTLPSPLDTFLRLDNWKKGAAFLNGFNLGRYWTPMGPQKTLYVPYVLFKSENILNIIELEQAPCVDQSTAEFVDTPELNATVPLRAHAEFRKRGK